MANVESKQQRTLGVVAHHALNPEEGRDARPRVTAHT